MRIKKVCKLCIDIGMLVITLLLMASERTGIVLHMFLGAALFVLVVAHNILNLAWWAGIGREGRPFRFNRHEGGIEVRKEHGGHPPADEIVKADGD